MSTKTCTKKPINLKKNHKQKTKESLILKLITTVHGTNHSSLKNRITSKLWLLLMVLNLLATVGLLMVVRRRFNSDQIVTEIFSDTKVNAIPFPAVSICNFNIVSINESNNIVDLLKRNNIAQEQIQNFFRDIYYFNSYDIRNKTFNNYTKVMKILKSHYYNMQTMMAELSQKCERMLVSCKFNGMKKDCGKIFTRIQTYQGFCCAFNYAALNDVENPLQQDEDFEYYVDRSNNENTNIITTAQSGRTSGLKVVINVEPNNYQPWLSVFGARVIISDPNDFPEITVRYKHVVMGESLTMKVDPEIYMSDHSLRRISAKRRGCWFHDEVFLEHTARYSFETCNTECRMKTFMQRCGCLPYKYPAEPSTRFCELSDLPCLNDMVAHWSSHMHRCKPECFLECSDKTYTVTSDSVPFNADNFNLQDQNVSELSSVHVYFMKPTCNTYKQSMLIDPIFYIATYGGLLSLSFGVSLLTFAEILYLTMSRVIQIIRNVSKKFAKKNKVT